MLTKVALRHKTHMFKWIESASEDVVLRMPADRVAATNDMEKLFGGSGGEETEYGTPVTLECKVSSGKVPGNLMNEPVNQGAEPLGILAESDVILTLKLEDALVDSTKPFGRTYFDQCKDVQVRNSTFEVTGAFRSGFAPLGPYLLWVGLRNAGE